MTVGRVILASGCFWGAQELLRSYPGVLATRTGYCGGRTLAPTNSDHDGHAMCVEVVYDRDVTSLRELLEFFFQIHDPTTPNRQGEHVGPSYRSAIFHTSQHQRRIALETISDIEESGRWPGKIVTEVAPAGSFWEAEPEHQDFLQKHAFGYTCHRVRPEWTLQKRVEPPA